MPRMPKPFKITDTLPADAVLVCAPARQGYFADDMPAKCSACGGGIVHRPDMAGIATKVCLPCYRAQAKPDDEFLITPRSIAECRLFLSTSRGRA